eukprot:g4477.t1
MLDNFISPYDATVVSKLKESGAVCLGKTNMDEFAMGSSNETSYYGPVQNPWDTGCVPGGSSGGSAAAVAARLAPAATATDTGGSIRQPAALCGITGLKPTYGRVSRWGMIAFASSMDQGGPMARTAEDCALLLNAMSGFDEKDSTSIDRDLDDFVSPLNASLDGLKVGVPKEFFGEGLNAEVEIAVQNALREYEKLGAILVDIDLPHSHLAVPTYYVLAPAEASANLSRFDGVRYGHRCEEPTDLMDLYCRSREEGFGEEVQRRIMVGAYVLSAGYYDAYYRKAQQTRRLIKNDFVSAFEQVDIIAGPTCPAPAFAFGAKSDNPVEMYLEDIYTISVNLAGLPGMSLPCGLACAIDLAMPGTLPVVNEEAVRMAVQFGLAIDAEIGKKSVFERKNYFYPDLPKGYQTTQLAEPIVGPGIVQIHLDDGSSKDVRIHHAHLEEDAGKSLHEDYHGMSGIDLNRAGTPLIEIVSEPDMRTAEEAVAYLKQIHAVITYLGISDGDMSQGSMRCDANVSIRPKGQEELGTRTELKNINSFRFVEKAIHTEVARQIDLIEDGGNVVQETRLYDAEKNETRSMRSKEVANDYRYFPCPDLLPIILDDNYIAAERAKLPELPKAKLARFEANYKLSSYDANVLTQERATADYFEAVTGICGDPKLAANWVTVELAGQLNKASLNIEQSPISAENLGGLIKRIQDATISGKIAKQVFEAMWNGEGDADDIIEAKGLKQVSDTGAIEAMIDEVMTNNPDQVENYRSAPEDRKPKMLGFFVGQGEKFDPDGDYTRRFVPELEQMPRKYLYRPWEAPEEVLNGAAVELGKTYPHPIVEIKASRESALAAFASIKISS